MSTGIHKCSCGTHFGLKVELVLHCSETGHAAWAPPVVAAPEPVAVEAAPVVEAPVAKKPRLSPKVARPLLAAALLASLLGFNVLMEKAVQTCTALQTTFASQVVCP